jgi:hypothetical protein
MNSYFHISTVFRKRREALRIFFAIGADTSLRGINQGGVCRSLISSSHVVRVLFVCPLQVLLEKGGRESYILSVAFYAWFSHTDQCSVWGLRQQPRDSSNGNFGNLPVLAGELGNLPVTPAFQALESIPESQPIPVGS